MKKTTAPRAEPVADIGAPRLAGLWSALVYALATLWLGAPALAGKFLINIRSDQYLAGYAFREFAAHTLRTTGSFPLWNPYIYGGLPYVAAMHGDIFYPTFLLRMIMPTDVAMTVGFMVHIFLAGLFTYYFLRAWGLGFYPALIGGLAYMMGGPIASYVSPGHDGKLFVSALTPLALWMLIRGIRDGKLWAFGVFAFATGLAVLSPHPQLLQYMLLISGAFTLFLAFAASDDGVKLPRKTALTRLGLSAAAVAIGMVIGAVQYLPVMEYVPWSPRAGGKGYEYATTYSFPIEELINTYVPQFSGILDNYWGRNGIHLHSEYLGVSILILAVLGFGAVRSARRSFARFWLGTMLVALLWALGGSTPFFHIIYAIVPGTKFFRAPSTIIYLVGLAIAVFAALGVERALTLRFSRGYLIKWGIAAAVLLLLGVSGGLTSMATTLAIPQMSERVPLGANALVIGSLRSFFAAAVTLGVLFALLTGKLRPVTAAWALAALVALDLWSIERLYWQFSPPAAQLYASDAIIDSLKATKEPARVLALQLTPQTDARRDPYLSTESNGLMVHGIRQVVGYHGNSLGRYNDLIEGRQLIDPQLWHLLNVRYLLTDADTIPLEGTKRIAGPVKNVAGSTEYLYQLPGDNAFAWVAPVIVKAGDEPVRTTIFDPRFDATRVALVDSAAPVVGTQISAMPPATGIGVHTASYAPGHIQLELSKPAPTGSALVVSENYYPGWKATVDGKEAPVVRTDYSLMSVVLPAGATHVKLTFTSPAYQRGKMLTLLALALSLVWIGAGVVFDRRRRG